MLQNFASGEEKFDWQQCSVAYNGGVLSRTVQTIGFIVIFSLFSITRILIEQALDKANVNQQSHI